MDRNVESRVKSVMSSVFDISEDSIVDNTAPGNIESWDSLKHMNLMVALEEEFGIDLGDDEIDSMVSYFVIVSTVKPYVDDD